MIRKVLIAISSLLALALVCFILVLAANGWGWVGFNGQKHTLNFAIREGRAAHLWNGEVCVSYKVRMPRDRLRLLLAQGNDRFYENVVYSMKRFGFRIIVYDMAILPELGKRKFFLTVPLWAVRTLLLLFCLYPTIAFVRGPYRRHRRRKRGLCLTCGYNLTGNVSGVCPECGEKI